MSGWECRSVVFKFQLSDWTLFNVPVRMQVRAARLIDDTVPIEKPTAPADPLMEGSQGYAIRGLPIKSRLPSVSLVDGFLCYVPLQYTHYYIDLSSSFDAYERKFSSKTRSTILRKVRKYTEFCGGSIPWRTYRSTGEMREFFRLAGVVSKKSYQARLLDAGLPDTEEYIREAESLAATQRVRAFVLFDGERPVSYLYCPVFDDVLMYAHLGYDPEYMQKSVGTVLHWLAIEQLFAEQRFRYLDFTEGQSEHKRVFATHHRQCANVFLMKATISNAGLVFGQVLVDHLSRYAGLALDKLEMKAKVKRLLRFRSVDVKPRQS